MMMLVLLLSFSAYSQAWIPLFYSPYPPIPTQSESVQEVKEERYQEPPDMEDPYGYNVEHYSWDNIYLCQYCDTEIIIDPYGS